MKKSLVRASIDDIRWHDLRHTWASWPIQTATPLDVLQKLGEWANDNVILRYAQLSSEHLRLHANRSVLRGFEIIEADSFRRVCRLA